MATSNFMAHANECKFCPAAQSSEQFQAAWERQHKALPLLLVDSDPSPWDAETAHEMLGLNHPIFVISKSKD
jgi:hypothetical protein